MIYNNILFEGIKWCIEMHRKSHHFYDGYITYEFHLRMVATVYVQFKRLLPENYITKNVEIHRGIWEDEDITHQTIELACYGHDLIEDARQSYNDVKKKLGEFVADIIYAVTNEKGKNREEKANDKYYGGIRSTTGAIFVKLCDRIANVTYSKITGSRMLERYKIENDHFKNKIYDPMFDEMFVYLEKLFE